MNTSHDPHPPHTHHLYNARITHHCTCTNLQVAMEASASRQLVVSVLQTGDVLTCRPASCAV